MDVPLFSLLKESYCWTPWSPFLSPGKCKCETEVSHISSSMKACFVCKQRNNRLCYEELNEEEVSDFNLYSFLNYQ